MAFDMPGGMPHFKGSKKGRIYLTTHRVSNIIIIYGKNYAAVIDGNNNGYCLLILTS